MAIPVRQVAALLRERQPGMSKWKLHKLLYYCQGHHLAGLSEPLFNEAVSAWDDGPVVGTLWYAEEHGEPPADGQPPEPDEGALNTIGYVLSRYGGLTGSDLRRLTHGEDPWRDADARRTPGGSEPIPRDAMREFFRLPGDDDPEVDETELRAWLAEARLRRDVPGVRDDPERIAARIADLRTRVAQR